MSGRLFVISAPSGTGKTSILKEVMKRMERTDFSVSHTTRQPRGNEIDGQDYYFVDEPKFRKMIEGDAFLEWARVHDNYYGTAVAPLQQLLQQDVDVFLDIDVQGAAIVRAESKLPANHIFIAPPDLEELERRLRGRGTEDEKSVAKRMQNARNEMAQCDKYDYLIVNDILEDAVAMICAIITAERAKGRRSIHGYPL